MNPVMLPKRKEFGFLKPPSAVSASLLITPSQRKLIEQNQSYHHFNYAQSSNAPAATTTTTTSIPRVSVLSKYSNDSTKQQQLVQNYLFDPLKVKYEISNHLLGKSYTSSTNRADFTLPKYPHRGMSGSSVRNQIKRHQIITVPINSRLINSSTGSKSSINKIDATQFLQQLINKRKEKTTISQSCRNCGINYFENNRCLYCEYNNSTNVVWLPNLARQQLIPAISHNETNVNKQNNVVRAESTSLISCKSPLSKQHNSHVTRNKTAHVGDTKRAEFKSAHPKQALEDQREQKVKSTASDYYGDSTVLLDENTDDSFENNNVNNSNNIHQNSNYTENAIDFSYKSNNFQPYDENYKYCNEEEVDDQDYQNVVPKLTLWLV